MPRKNLQAPVHGVTDAATFTGQPAKATDPDGLRNVVPRNSANGRRQMATRPKAKLEFGGAASSGTTGGIGNIARASGVTAVIAVNPTSGTTGVTSYSGLLRGQAVVLDPDGAVRMTINDTRGTGLANPPSGAGGYGAFGCCWHSTNPDVGYTSTIAADTATADSGGKVVIGISRFDQSTRTITHQSYAVDASSYTTNNGVNGGFTGTPAAGTVDLFANHMVQWKGYLFLAAFRYVYCFRADTLAYVTRHLIDWCEEVNGLKALTVAGTDYLLTACLGSRTVAGPVVTDSTGSGEQFGEFYRSAIATHRISYANNAAGTPVATGATVLTRTALPMGLQSGGAGYEDHRTFRPSEYSLARPRGCLIYAFDAAAASDGTTHAYIARTNQGFGYSPVLNATHRPDGAGPYISCCRAVLTRGFETGRPTFVDPATGARYGLSSSVGGWERDTDSLRRAFSWNSLTYQNDIPPISGGGRDPQAPGSEPTFWAVAVDTANNRVFFAGRRSRLSGSAPNVYAFEADTGTLLWWADTGATIQQNGIAIDPTSGNLVCAMLRNHRWTKPDGTTAGTGEDAEMIELSGETGQTVKAFDLTNTVNLNGYLTPANTSNPDDPAGSRIGAYGVSVNSRGQALVALAPYRYQP